MDAFCERMRAQRDSVRFLFDGRRVDLNKTAADNGMEDGDEIGVMVEQC